MDKKGGHMRQDFDVNAALILCRPKNLEKEGWKRPSPEGPSYGHREGFKKS